MNQDKNEVYVNQCLEDVSTMYKKLKAEYSNLEEYADSLLTQLYDADEEIIRLMDEIRRLNENYF